METQNMQTSTSLRSQIQRLPMANQYPGTEQETNFQKD